MIKWLRSRRKDYLLTTPSPWLTFDAINYLKQKIQSLPNACIFEYGSGGSTLFWQRLGASIVSIEHDPAWFSVVRRYLCETPAIDYRLIAPQFDSERPADFADPQNYRSGDKAFKGYSFYTYVSQIDDFPDDYFDIVVIDGRARPACIMHSVHKVKRNGILVLDNAEIAYYTEKTSHLLNHFAKTAFYGALPLVPWYSETAIYYKHDT